MSERASKLRRLNGFRRALPHVSASALSAILAEVAAEGMPELHSRRDLSAATAELMNESTPYGPIAQTVDVATTDGGTMRLLVAHPLALLWHAVRVARPFANFVQARLSEHPASAVQPWRLVLYADEVVPGNQLSHDNRRKVWVVYYSFLEFGPAALAREESWFCLMTKRSSEVAKVSGGMGQIYGKLVKLFHGNVHDIATTGLVFNNTDGSVMRVFSRLAMFVQDGGAHKVTWHCKGDAGTKMCMLCRNLYSQKSEIVDEDGSNLLTCSLIHESDLDFATDDDIRGSVRRLAAKHASEPAAVFAKWSQAIGFRHEPHSMLLDPTLDTVVFPAKQFVHDWMHCIFVHGCFNTIAYLVLEACLADGIRNVYELLHNYVGEWVLPTRVGSPTLKEMFSKKRATSSRKAKHLKCTASEGLSVYPMMAYFCRKVLLRAGRCVAVATAFVELAGTVDLLAVVPLGLVTGNMLRGQVAKLLQACLDAGWAAYMHPKFHWLVHIPMHLETFGTLPTCWVHERKHRPRRYTLTEPCSHVGYQSHIAVHRWTRPHG